MYIRIQDNSIRYRVSKREASQLVNGEKLFQTLTLSPFASLTYAINSSNQKNHFVYAQKTNGLLLTINRKILTQELDRKPSKTGIVFAQQILEKKLTISLEIDLKNK